MIGQTTKTSTMLVALFLSAGMRVAHAQAQTGEGVATELASLRAELLRLRGEVTELRAEVRRLAASERALGIVNVAAVPTVTTQEPQATPDLSATVSLLQSQLADQAQVKVESNSRLPVKLFGTIHSSTFVNSGEANWLENPNIVQPDPPPDAPKGSFSSTLRQTRLGLTVDGLRVGSLHASGLVAFDFTGGVPAFQTGTAMGLPRLLYGFARLESERTAFEVGQDEMVLAPRDPTSLAALAFPELFRSGNLYLRVPQIRVEQKIATGATSAMKLTGALVAPLAGDFTTTLYTFAPPAGSGERSRVPAFQARAGWSVRSQAGDPVFDVGVSGHYGRQRLEVDTRESWAGAVDLDLTVGRIGFGGEFFTGDRLAAFGGALGQQARSTGGFFEGRVSPTESLRFVSGLGIDQVDDQGGAVALEENFAYFGNVTYRFTPELAGSVEYRWLRTTAATGAERENHHVNWALAFSF
jgi:hypothetical protein